MVTEKKYKWNNGILEETLTNDMIGWEVVVNGITTRIVNESISIFTHSQNAECKYRIESKVGNKWLFDRNENAIISKSTYCNELTGEPVTDAFDKVDDLANPILNEEGEIVSYPQIEQLKANVVNEWDFYFPMFFTPNVQAPSLHAFVKNGASIKLGIAL